MSMSRSVFSVSRRAIHASSRILSTAEGTSAVGAFIVNFCTPHQSILVKKTIDKIVVPGEAGEFGITFGHTPIISQLKPGVVTIMHIGGEIERYFISGGFSITHKDNAVTDVSVSEAVKLEDLDHEAVKEGYAQAMRDAAAASEGSASKVQAQIESNTYFSLGRALGITL